MPMKVASAWENMNWFVPPVSKNRHHHRRIPSKTLILPQKNSWERGYNPRSEKEKRSSTLFLKHSAAVKESKSSSETASRQPYITLTQTLGNLPCSENQTSPGVSTYLVYLRKVLIFRGKLAVSFREGLYPHFAVQS